MDYKQAVIRRALGEHGNPVVKEEMHHFKMAMLKGIYSRLKTGYRLVDF